MTLKKLCGLLKNRDHYHSGFLSKGRAALYEPLAGARVRRKKRRGQFLPVVRGLIAVDVTTNIAVPPFANIVRHPVLRGRSYSFTDTSYANYTN